MRQPTQQRQQIIDDIYGLRPCVFDAKPCPNGKSKVNNVTDDSIQILKENNGFPIINYNAICYVG